MHHRTVAIALALQAEVKETTGDDVGVCAANLCNLHEKHFGM